jgi:hypothetical protein
MPLHYKSQVGHVHNSGCGLDHALLGPLLLGIRLLRCRQQCAQGLQSAAGNDPDSQLAVELDPR